ncbi:hypothetical protein F6X53_06715 [Methylobacterium soli]|uniref:Uncharacterized protein n=1 Tax=Methylobacterium soli TaxID=553447 RepID=A0A6L3T1F5_9HYPH|nr:hypothetical protein F6X53_06715 [Methylobacterium soli]
MRGATFPDSAHPSPQPSPGRERGRVAPSGLVLAPIPASLPVARQAPPLPSGRGRVGASRPGEGCGLSGQRAPLTPARFSGKLSRTGEGARRATRACSDTRRVIQAPR